jgi:hypothetical protein
MAQFRITILSTAAPISIIDAVKVFRVTVYYTADNSFAAYQYAKVVAADYFGANIDAARYIIEEILAV